MRRPDTGGGAVDAVDGDGTAGASDGPDGGRFRNRLHALFAPRPFLLVLALSVVGLVAGGSVPAVGFLGRFLGIAAAGFLLAFLDADRRYVEAGLAGTLTAGVGVLLNAVGTTFLPVVADYGVEIAGVGATMGLLAGVVGHYLGRDLRAGLTREV